MSNHCCSAYEEYDIICCNAVVFGICAKAAKLHKPLGRILNGRRRGREVLYLKILSVSMILDRRLQENEIWVRSMSRMILSGKDRSTRINLSSVKIRGLINNLTGNTNRGTHIKMWTFTYNLLRPKHVSIFFRPSSGILHQTSIHTTQTNYQTEKI